jgi:hypothetical protein
MPLNFKIVKFEIETQIKEGNKASSISVTDSWCGIPKDKLDSILIFQNSIDKRVKFAD